MPIKCMREIVIWWVSGLQGMVFSHKSWKIFTHRWMLLKIISENWGHEEHILWTFFSSVITRSVQHAYDDLKGSQHHLKLGIFIFLEIWTFSNLFLYSFFVRWQWCFIFIYIGVVVSPGCKAYLDLWSVASFIHQFISECCRSGFIHDFPLIKYGFYFINRVFSNQHVVCLVFKYCFHCTS